VIDLTDRASKIELARRNLTDKLTELRRREASVRSAVAPIRYLANPWLHLGIAVVIGYRFGGAVARARATTTVVPSPSSAPSPQDSLPRTLVRAGMVAIAQVVVRRVVTDLVDAR
jgi:hypothetical protein